MKKYVIMAAICVAVSNTSQAQIPIVEIIKVVVKKVIKAIDLQVQRLQNKTIWLQNAQKAVENEMSKLKLDEISDWVEKQRKLYADYFEELEKVKEAIAVYHKVKEIINKQALLVDEYKSAYNLFKQDSNFTVEELDYMEKVYSGMLDESLKNLDQLFLVINSLATKMTDAARIEIINSAGDQVEKNLADLRKFNNQNKMLSFQRAAEKGDVDVVKKLYGLE